MITVKEFVNLAGVEVTIFYLAKNYQLKKTNLNLTRVSENNVNMIIEL